MTWRSDVDDAGWGQAQMIHFTLLVLFALAVGIAMGMVLRQEPRQVVALAAWIAGGMIVGALLVGWLLRLLAP